MPGLTLCLVGAGPRGIAVLERICANIAADGDPDVPVVVHLADAVADGGGRVWRTDQPPQLLMNTVASQVSLFTDDSVDCAGSITPGPTLYEWARFLTLITVFDGYPDHVLAEAKALGPDSYPTRAFFGHYAAWVLDRVISTAPRQVSVVRHQAVATALDDAPDGTQVLTLDDGTRLSGLDAVVLAQGHVGVELSAAEQTLARFAESAGLRYFPPANPADVDFSPIAPGERVGLRGLGLNFFDCLAMLTEGRGGAYEHADGRLVYRPSGAEPVLYAGSRRGVPYHARGQNQKGPSSRHEPVFLTLDVVRALRARGPLRFMTDVWPLVSREVRLVYYRTLVAERDGAPKAETFAREFAGVVTRGELAESALLYRYGVSERWNWDRVANPYGERVFDSDEAYQEWLACYLVGDVVEAMLGNVHGAVKAALDVLRDLRNELRLVVDHGGLHGDSYRAELQDWYTPMNAFLSIGPPVERIEQLLALLDAGVLHMLAPGMTVRPATSGTAFVVGADGTEVTTLIEARLPDVDLRRTTDPLLRHLRATGQCRAYRLPAPAGEAYETGGLTVTRRPYHVVDAQGRAHPRRFAFGVPTETVHWVTAAGIRPGVNSVILGDADAIARTVLGLAVSAALPVAGVPA